MPVAIEQTATLEPRYVTVHELAKYFRCAPQTVRGWMHQGRLTPSCRAGKSPLFTIELVRHIEAHGLPPSKFRTPGRKVRNDGKVPAQKRL